jgi:hypothetical protein
MPTRCAKWRLRASPKNIGRASSQLATAGRSANGPTNTRTSCSCSWRRSNIARRRCAVRNRTASSSACTALCWTLTSESRCGGHGSKGLRNAEEPRRLSRRLKRKTAPPGSQHERQNTGPSFRRQPARSNPAERRKAHRINA